MHIPYKAKRTKALESKNCTSRTLSLYERDHDHRCQFAKRFPIRLNPWKIETQQQTDRLSADQIDRRCCSNRHSLHQWWRLSPSGEVFNGYKEKESLGLSSWKWSDPGESDWWCEVVKLCYQLRYSRVFDIVHTKPKFRASVDNVGNQYACRVTLYARALPTGSAYAFVDLWEKGRHFGRRDASK